MSRTISERLARLKRLRGGLAKDLAALERWRSPRAGADLQRGHPLPASSPAVPRRSGVPCVLALVS